MTDTVPPLDPRRTALLVMDFQHAVLGLVADTDALLARAADAIATARDAGAHVGYVRVAFTDADIAAVPATNKAFANFGQRAAYLHVDAPTSAIHERVAPLPNDVVVHKVRVGAFSTTDLHAQLQARGVDTLVLAGISTSGVVLSTVRDAADRDYRLVVLSDACADPEPDVHELLTQKVFPRQAFVVRTDALREALSGAR
jgi:nicotinamidase-related amidase